MTSTITNTCRVTATVAGSLLVLGIAVSGCDSTKSSTSSSSSSSSSTTPSSSPTVAMTGEPAPEFANLLINPNDMTDPDFVFTAKEPPQADPGGQPGVAAVFTHNDGSREIRDTILVLADAAAATAALEKAKASLGDSVKGGTPAPAEVGTGGTLASGSSPDGSKSVSVLLFTEGRAFTTLQFTGPPKDPAPADFVTEVGQKQATVIGAGLPK